MAVAEIAVVPVGTDQASYSRFVAAALNACDTRAVRHKVGAMSTVLEGEAVDIVRCALAMHQAVLEAGAERVCTQFTIDERRDRRDGIERRIASAEAQAASTHAPVGG